MPKDDYISLTRTDKTIPSQLLKNFSNIPRDASGDMLGKIYQYFLGKFALEDQATVPLCYEKRFPEVLIQNDDLSEEVYALLEDENLEPAQQEKLEKHFTKEMQVIVRDERLDTIAKDIVYHFPRRGYLGKGMVVALDKFTAVKMYY